MRQLGLAAVAAEVSGIQLGVARSNAGALALYDRLGFRELSADADTMWLGISPKVLLFR